MLINVTYPETVLRIKEVKAAIDAGDKMSTGMEDGLEELDGNTAISSSFLSGISHREKVLGIQPSDTASLEDRRLEVLLRWYDTPLYTETTLRRKLDSVLGAGKYDLTIDLDKKLASCQIELTKRHMFTSVQDLFEQMMPLDYSVYVTLRYCQHYELEQYTHAELATRTHDQIRNEVFTDGNRNYKLRT